MKCHGDNVRFLRQLIEECDLLLKKTNLIEYGIGCDYHLKNEEHKKKLFDRHKKKFSCKCVHVSNGES